MAYEWILYDGAKNQMEIWSTKLDINIVVTTNFYMKESPHSNVVCKCTNHLGFLGCIFKSARWILQLWNHRQPWRETLLRHFITCMHLIKRLKRLLKPSKPLGFSWLQFVFSTLVHTCAQPRKWVFKITSVAGRGLHWEFHDRQPGPFAEGPCGRALCGRPLLSGEGEPPAGEGDPIWGAVRLMIYHDVPTKHDEFP